MYATLSSLSRPVTYNIGADLPAIIFVFPGGVIPRSYQQLKDKGRLLMATTQPLVSCHEAERNHHALLDDFHTAEDEEDKENEPAYDELTLNTAPKDLLWHVHHLRHRLERRNAVLDAVRKAYHADIVVVREHLHRCFGGKDSPLPSSLPSLDLRPALELFAPKECLRGTP